MEDLEHIVPDDIPESLTVTLRKPVSLGDQSYTQLALREPTAAEWQQWSKLEGVEADIMAVSIVSGTPKPVVDRIGARDLMTAARYLARFLG